MAFDFNDMAYQGAPMNENDILDVDADFVAAVQCPLDTCGVK